MSGIEDIKQARFIINRGKIEVDKKKKIIIENERFSELKGFDLTKALINKLADDALTKELKGWKLLEVLLYDHIMNKIERGEIDENIIG